MIHATIFMVLLQIVRTGGVCPTNLFPKISEPCATTLTASSKCAVKLLGEELIGAKNRIGRIDLMYKTLTGTFNANINGGISIAYDPEDGEGQLKIGECVKYYKKTDAFKFDIFGVTFGFDKFGGIPM